MHEQTTPQAEYGIWFRRRGDVLGIRQLAGMGLLAGCASVPAELPASAGLEPATDLRRSNDEPESVAPNEPLPVSPSDDATSTASDPDGVSFHDLDMRARAKAVRFGDGWGVEVTLTVTATGDRTFRLESLPAPHFMGTTEQPTGSEPMEFSDGCWSNLQDPLDAELAPGDSKSFTKKWDPILPVGPDETARIMVGLCRIGVPGGDYEDHHGPVVTLQVNAVGRPHVHVDNPPPR